MDDIEKKHQIRDAATILLLRKRAGRHQVLMGQRGASAAFMPNKYVFPGGVIDPQDYEICPDMPLNGLAMTKLSIKAPANIAQASAMAAIRELWEETGLILGQVGTAPKDIPHDWQGFFAKDVVPRAGALNFMFRAVTPPGRPRRFDARFFWADSAGIVGSDEDFAGASDELSHLHWIDLEAAKALDLPFVTEVVLSEIIAIMQAPDTPRKVPFFYHDDERSHFMLL
ncbi:MAG: NUDIX hydrolase [Paracoccaceae bacterium]